MAAIKATRLWSGQNSSQTSAPSGRHSEVWQVLVEPGDSSLVAMAANGLPKYNDRHPDNAGYYCTGVNVTEALGPTVFNVQVDYSLIVGDIPPNEKTPLDEPAKININFESVTEPIDRDIHGKPIVNTIGDQFNPPLQEEFCDKIITVSRNEARFNSQWDSLNNKLNASPIFGYAAGCVRFNYSASQASATLSDGSTLNYWQVTYTFKCRQPHSEGQGGWVRRIANTGMRYKNERPSSRAEAYLPLDHDAKPSEPYYLDPDGYKIEPDDVLAGKVHWLFFETKQSAELGVLNLPAIT